MKHKPYIPVDMDDQHLKNRIRAQMEADAYWKMKREQQDARRALNLPFDPLAFRFKVSRYARHHHRTKHELVRMSEYCKRLQEQATKVKAVVRFFKGVA